MATKKKNFGKELMGYFQSGVSYLIPLLCASGLLTSLAVVFGGQGVWKETDTLWGVMRMIGQTGLGFITPMIAAYIAFAIADRPGLAPAFIVGLIAAKMGTGFLGGMIVGLVVGFMAQYLKKIPLPASLQSLKSMLIIPLIVTTVSGLLMWYVIGVPIKGLTDFLTAWLNGMSGANLALLGIILGAMMAFDMGGPVNKIANAFGMAAFAQGAYATSTIVMTAISIPPTVVFIATLIGKKFYDKSDIDNARTAIIMGLVGITEGTIPFAVKDPLRVIPSIMTGTAITCAMVGGLHITHQSLLTTYTGMFLTNNPVMYIISILVGSTIGAIMLNLLKSFAYRKQEKTSKAEEVD
ncbi:PTS fructose transporter subunit IIC [Lacticaseibacillus pabuli]|uniref:PTS fructose transporter subunit IIC n=1 Tax=Lacticaseibacillus pabuli TaxID=3025672 RepID=A0ABY7WSN2_9LACO|nr:PTS fructose transporter subunit IIC [Lacticaseibacillus sp. KACC 23028]WDF83189.1 PTS fructose transporter subunit IIC [Lacticaseibacillus sp. KACC 23028]